MALSEVLALGCHGNRGQGQSNRRKTLHQTVQHVDLPPRRTKMEQGGDLPLALSRLSARGSGKRVAEQRVTDQYDDLPNSWTFGVYFNGDLYSSVRISVLTPEWRQSCSAEAFGEILHPLLDRGQIIIDPARFVADPGRVKRLPELPYLPCG